MDKLIKFYELSKAPIVVGTVAAVLFIVDSLISPLFDLGRGFMWVAFVAWTISAMFGWQDKVKLIIGNVIGFGAAVGMIYFGQIFDASVVGVAIAATTGVFLFNGLVMYFDNFKKFWLSSIVGIFMGIFLTFSGLGVSLGAETAADAFTLLGILLLYSILGCICGTVHIWWAKRWNARNKLIGKPQESPTQSD